MLPAGYRPGSLLSRLRHDLCHLECEPLSDTCVRFHASDRQIEFYAEERVEAQFLMHVVNTEFFCCVPDSAPGNGHVRIRHTGTWKRRGITCVASNGSDRTTQDLARRLSGDPHLASVMLPLDFTRCELAQDSQGWRVRVVHFGACEVAYRVPPIRHYVRLPSPQLDALNASFQELKRLLRAGPLPSALSYAG